MAQSLVKKYMTPKRWKNIIRIPDQANRFGRHDMERLGLFVEMNYMNGKGYVTLFPKPPRYGARNMMCPRYQSKNGTQHGYFESTFQRLFEGEAIKRPPKRNDEAKESKKKKPTFTPAGVTKWHSCPGDYYGTFGGIVKSFSVSGAVDQSQLKKEGGQKKDKRKPKKPMVTSPGKKGGPGYPNICLSKYPEYTYNNIVHVYGTKFKYKEYGRNRGAAIKTAHCPQPFFDANPFFEDKPKKGQLYQRPKDAEPPIIGMGRWTPAGPAKWQGGCHAGMFEPFPVYKTDRNKKKEDKERQEKLKKRKGQDDGAKFGPQSMALKTMLTSSVLNQNTDMRVNCLNYKTYEPIYTKNLLAA